MMVTINFYTIDERMPEHGAEILYLRPFTNYGYYGFEPKETIVEYRWFWYDSQGIHTGDQVNYDPETESNFKVGDTIVSEDNPSEYLKLEVIFDEWCVTELNGNPRKFLWTPIEEYWNSVY